MVPSAAVLSRILSGPFRSTHMSSAEFGCVLPNFVRWYNTEHLHSALAFVTPEDRHRGRDTALLARRRMVYTQAREAHPERWTGRTRDWTPLDTVALNPPKQESTRAATPEAAA